MGDDKDADDETAFTRTMAAPRWDVSDGERAFIERLARTGKRISDDELTSMLGPIVGQPPEEFVATKRAWLNNLPEEWQGVWEEIRRLAEDRRGDFRLVKREAPAQREMCERAREKDRGG